MSDYSKLAFFVGGTLFGSVGLKLLSTREAKKGYVYATAAGLCAKDYVMETVTSVQENASDILASAKELKGQWETKRASEDAAAVILDESEPAEEATAETAENPVETAESENTEDTEPSEANA